MWTLDKALNDDLITVLRRDDENGWYVFRLGKLSTPVTVRLTKKPNRTEFRASHLIKTPEQAGPYVTSRPWNDNAPLALHDVITGLTMYYRDARPKGVNSLSWPAAAVTEPPTPRRRRVRIAAAVEGIVVGI